MNFDELKERLQAEWTKSLDQLEENRLYVEIKDRYENLTPIQQRILLGGVIGTVVLVLFSLPYSYYSASDDSLAEFTDKRQLIRDLLRTAKESKESPEIPMPPPMESLKTTIDTKLTDAKLLPEQITGTSIESAQGGIVNRGLVEGILKVSLADLNLRQIVEFGTDFSNLGASVKLKDIQIQASTKEAGGYFNVIYNILVLKVKPKQVAEEEPKRKPKK